MRPRPPVTRRAVHARPLSSKFRRWWWYFDKSWRLRLLVRRGLQSFGLFSPPRYRPVRAIRTVLEPMEQREPVSALMGQLGDITPSVAPALAAPLSAFGPKSDFATLGGAETPSFIAPSSGGG